MIVGAVLGLILAAGLLLAVWAAPPMRPIRIEERIAPYLADAAATPSSLLDRPRPASTSFGVPVELVRRLFGPAMQEIGSFLDRIIGGATSIRRRLGGIGSSMSVEEFRIEQLTWGAAGFVAAGGALAAFSVLRGGVDPVVVTVAALAGLVAGVLGRDWSLSHRLRRREAVMLAEFPVVADLLALAVVAGEAPVDALVRVCRLTGGELARDLGTAIGRVRTGTPIARALAELAESTTLEPFSRFLQGVVVAIERGTPLADVLRAQAMDVREAGKRALLEAGGRKEISMMLPVVFLILPITVLFALYPGLITLVALTN